MQQTLNPTEISELIRKQAGQSTFGDCGLEETYEQIRNEMLTSRVQQRRVGNRVRVTDREVENYLQAQQANGITDAEYRLAYIFIEVDDPASEASVDEARETAQALRQQIANGRDFREVAVAESDASNALEGGDMGWRSESRCLKGGQNAYH